MHMFHATPSGLPLRGYNRVHKQNGMRLDCKSLTHRSETRIRTKNFLLRIIDRSLSISRTIDRMLALALSNPTDDVAIKWDKAPGFVLWSTQ